MLSVRAWRRLRARRPAARGVGLGSLLFAGFALQTVGLKRTTPSRGGVHHRAVRAARACGCCCSSGGCRARRRWWGWRSRSRASASSRGRRSRRGRVAEGGPLTLGCAMAFAFHIVLHGAGAPGRTLTRWWRCSCGWWRCCPRVPALRAVRDLDVSPAFWGRWLYTGVLQHGRWRLLQTWAQARTSAVRAAIIFSLEPVFAASSRWWWGGSGLGRGSGWAGRSSSWASWRRSWAGRCGRGGGWSRPERWQQPAV